MSERDTEFDEMLDECYPPYQLGYLTFYASDILFECDPIAYRIGAGEYHDAQCSDGVHDYSDGVCQHCEVEEEKSCELCNDTATRHTVVGEPLLSEERTIMYLCEDCEV